MTTPSSNVGADASHKSVPEWARDKARNLLITSGPIKRGVTYNPSQWIVDVVATLIAKHEDEPVDPLEEAMVEWSVTEGSNPYHPGQEVALLRGVLARHGFKIVEASK